MAMMLVLWVRDGNVGAIVEKLRNGGRRMGEELGGGDGQM
jgi:hypothetical protein